MLSRRGGAAKSGAGHAGTGSVWPSGLGHARARGEGGLVAAQETEAALVGGNTEAHGDASCALGSASEAEPGHFFAFHSVYDF